MSQLKYFGRRLRHFDKDAENIIKTIYSVDGIMLTETERYYVDFVVKGLKGIGVWDKIKALYGFVGGTAVTHRWNWKDMRDLDAAFRIVWNGGITHSSLGVQGDGATGNGNTFLNPVTQGLNVKASIGATFNIAGNTSTTLIGLGSGPSSIFYIAKNSFQFDAAGATNRNYSVSIFASKSIFASYDIINNPTVSIDGNSSYPLGLVVGSPTGIGNMNLSILHRTGTADYSNSRITSGFIGTVMSKSEITLMNNIMLTGQGILGRK